LFVWRIRDRVDRLEEETEMMGAAEGGITATTTITRVVALKAGVTEGEEVITMVAAGEYGPD
jgi:hypothetical protein